MVCMLNLKKFFTKTYFVCACSGGIGYVGLKIKRPGFGKKLLYPASIQETHQGKELSDGTSVENVPVILGVLNGMFRTP